MASRLRWSASKSRPPMSRRKTDLEIPDRLFLAKICQGVPVIRWYVFEKSNAGSCR
jgi:hypothetical protein